MPATQRLELPCPLGVKIQGNNCYPGVGLMNASMKQLSLCLSLIFLLPASGMAQDDRMERGQQILLPFKQQLMKALQTGLQDGPLAALNACNLQAPGIAGANSQGRIIMGRSSHKLRNPGNAAPGWVKPVMDDYLNNPDSRDPRVLTLGNGRLGYVEPILLQSLCTTCHGTQMASPVLERIHELYPADQATGFSAGELRGVFWITFPAE